MAVERFTMRPELRQTIISQIHSMMLSLRLEGMYSQHELDTMSDNQIEAVFNYLQGLEASK